MNAQESKPAERVARIPELDKEGKFTGPDWASAAKVFDGILEGGAAALVEVVGLLREQDDGQDFKARYVLHGLAVYVARPERREYREVYTKTLAAQLGGALPKPVKAFLVRQLQVAGGQEVVGALGGLLGDAGLYDSAAQALLAIRDGAAEQFRKALPGAPGRPRTTLIQSLGALRDAESLDALLKAAADPDRDTRLAAVWSLARIGDPGAVETVIKAADAPAGRDRDRATHACLVLAENLLASGRKEEAHRIYRHLRDSRTDPSEEYVREIAEKALG